MSFFFSHYVFTFCFLAGIVGTFIHSVAPDFSENCLICMDRKFNLGFFGISFFIHENFLHFIISFLLLVPGLLICEKLYGEEVTAVLFLIYGILHGVLCIVFDEKSYGFLEASVFFISLSCLYNFHVWAISLDMIIVGSMIAVNSEGRKIRIASIVLSVIITMLVGGLPKDNSKSYESSKPVFNNVDSGFTLPVSSSFYYSSEYGSRKDPFTGKMSFHKGVDMACAEGTKVVASDLGVVEATGYDELYGNYIIINHRNGYKTKYAHLSKIETTKGSTVTQGQKIGLVGSTGYSTGPHLHFMVIKDGKIINPKDVLK